jgi:hypothetical protein
MRSKIIEGIAAVSRRGFLLIFAAVAAFALATSVQLRTSNPFKISNPANAASGWNPETNYIQAILVIVLTVLIFWGLYTLSRKHEVWLRVVVGFIASVIGIAKFVIPAAVSGTFDPFHFGEQMSPALAFLQGKQPFTGLYVLHGAGEDIFKPALAFVLFNHGVPSIGSYVLITALAKGLSVFVFFALLALLIRSRTVFLGAALWFSATGFNGISYDKYIPMYLALALLWFVISSPRRGRTSLLALVGVGFLASLALLYSIDIGALTGAMSAVIAILMLFVRVDSAGRFGLVRPRWQLITFLPGLALTAGVLIGQALSFAVLRGSYLEFLKLTFIEIPRYQGLIWDYPIPGMSDNQFTFWLPIITIGLVVLLIVYRIITEWRTGPKLFSPQTAMSIVLLGVAVIDMRYGVGRPDTVHELMSAPPAYFALFFLISEGIRDWTVRTISELAIAIVAVASLLLPATLLDIPSLFLVGSQLNTDAHLLKALPGQQDDAWLNKQQLATVKYLKSHSTSGDSLWVMDPEPSYYYLTGLRNPTRFYISIFADPQPYTDEVTNDLKAHPPTFILYSTGSVYATLDGSKITDRLATLNKWIKANYTHKVNVDGSVILTRG